MRDISSLTRLILEFRKERNWQQFHKLKDMAISLNLEASELLELFQWKDDDEISRTLPEIKKDLGNELADIFYWVLLIAHDSGIDLADALQAKLEINREKYPLEKSAGSKKKYTEYK